MYRSLVSFLALIIATALGQNIITQGPKDVVLPVSAQARFTCTANSSLNVTKIGWLAITTAINGNPLTLTSNEQLSSVGINLLPSGSKFISEISVEGVAVNNGTLLSCRVTINGSVVPNAESTKAKLILYGPPDPVSSFTYAVAGIHSFNLSWTPISSSFPFNYTIDIVSAASSDTINLDRTTTDYVYKVDDPSKSCEEYNFTIRGVNEAGYSGESEVLTLTLPDVPSNTSINSSPVSFDTVGSPILTLGLSVPEVCSDYPVTSYSVTLRDKDSPNNFSLPIPAAGTRSHDNHVTLTLRDPRIGHDKVYLLSVVAENDVGPSQPTQEKKLITSNLQGLTASLYMHTHQLMVNCHYANGSSIDGCFVTVMLINGTQVINQTILWSQSSSLSSNASISLSEAYTHHSLIVMARDYNDTTGPGAVEITATPTLVTPPSSELVTSTTVAMTMESSYYMSSETPSATVGSTGPSSTEQPLMIIGIISAGLLIGILILMIPLMMSMIVLIRHCSERRKGDETTIQPAATDGHSSIEITIEGQNGTRTDTMRSNSTTKSDLKLVDSNPPSNAGLDVNSIVLVEGGADQGLVQPYGITNLIHKGLEVPVNPVYQDVNDTNYHQHVTPPLLISSSSLPSGDQSCDTPPLVPPRNQSNRSHQPPKQRIYHVLESPNGSQASTEGSAETPPPLYDEVAHLQYDKNLSPMTATPTNTPTQTPPFPPKFDHRQSRMKNGVRRESGSSVANGYKEPTPIGFYPSGSTSPQLPFHIFTSSSPSPLLTNGIINQMSQESSDADTPPLPLQLHEDSDEVFSSSTSATTPSPLPVVNLQRPYYQRLHRHHSQHQFVTKRTGTPQSYAVPSRSGSMPRGYQRPQPRGAYQRQTSCQASLRSHKIHPLGGEAAMPLESETVHIKKSSSIPSAMMHDTRRTRSNSVPGEEEINGIQQQYKGYSQGNWTLKRTLV